MGKSCAAYFYPILLANEAANEETFFLNEAYSILNSIQVQSK